MDFNRIENITKEQDILLTQILIEPSSILNIPKENIIEEMVVMALSQDPSLFLQIPQELHTLDVMIQFAKNDFQSFAKYVTSVKDVFEIMTEVPELVTLLSMSEFTESDIFTFISVNPMVIRYIPDDKLTVAHYGLAILINPYVMKYIPKGKIEEIKQTAQTKL